MQARPESIARFNVSFEVRFPHGVPYRLKEQEMPNHDHSRAAELRQNAAKSHRAAAEQPVKGDHAKGVEHSKSAQLHPESANKQSDQAHVKSQQHK
jgi:hypothetical protein